jgi:hypothetical protein
MRKPIFSLTSDLSSEYLGGQFQFKVITNDCGGVFFNSLGFVSYSYFWPLKSLGVRYPMVLKLFDCNSKNGYEKFGKIRRRQSWTHWNNILYNF